MLRKENRTIVDDLVPTLVDEQVRLRRFLVGEPFVVSVGRVADHRAVADEVRTHLSLVVMPEDVVRCTLADVGSHDVLRCGNRQTSHTALETNPMTVVESERHTVDVEVRSVRLRDEERDTLVVLVPLCKERVDHVLQAVA